jgi:hypothetical protein
MSKYYVIGESASADEIYHSDEEGDGRFGSVREAADFCIDMVVSLLPIEADSPSEEQIATWRKSLISSRELQCPELDDEIAILRIERG